MPRNGTGWCFADSAQQADIVRSVYCPVCCVKTVETHIRDPIMYTQIQGYEQLQGCIPLATLCCSDTCAAVYGQRLDELNVNYVRVYEVDTLHELGALCDEAALHADEHM
jgi:hypothetical protein